jgi:hypothetical protein
VPPFRQPTAFIVNNIMPVAKLVLTLNEVINCSNCFIEPVSLDNKAHFLS